MSHSAVTEVPAERFLSASAVYYRDLSRDREPCLVLGHLVELIYPPYLGLGLCARARLADRELECMDAIGRRLLAHPFDYLHAECTRVRRSASPGCAIAALSASHYAALKIAPPREMAPPAAIPRSQSPATARTMIAALGEMLDDGPSFAGPVSVDTFCQEF